MTPPFKHGQLGAAYKPTGPWALLASILAGTLLIGVFEPLMLLVSAMALVLMVLIHRASDRTHDHLLNRNTDLESLNTATMESVTQLRAVLNAADTPIVATNEHGVIIHANESARAILGSGRALIGDHFDSLIPDKTIQDLEELARSGEPGHARLSLPAGGTMRVFGIAAEPLETTTGAVCTFTDITELTQSATLKADFVANASHELRTPITSIHGAVETLLGPAKDDPAMAHRLVSMIAKNAQRLDMLVQDLLDLSKLESTSIPTTIIPFDLIELLEHTSEQFDQICSRRGLRIEIQNRERIRTIHSDPALVELIVRNLIQNATKFSNENTTVTIRLEPMRIALDSHPPTPAGADCPIGVRIGVRDQGIGIPIAHQRRVFERFYQVDEARSGSSAKRGTGLGLAIVKHASLALGGLVSIQSVHHQGTTVKIDLPRCLHTPISDTPPLSSQ